MGGGISLHVHRRQVWDQVLRKTVDDAIATQQELLKMTEEGKLDTTNGEELSYFLELTLEEKFIENRYMYKNLWSCYHRYDGRMTLPEVHLFTLHALQGAERSIPHMFSILVQLATDAAAQSLEHMSENYDRKISDADLDLIQSTLNETLQQTSTKALSRILTMMDDCDQVAAQVYEKLNAPDSQGVTLDSFLANFFHVSNQLFDPDYGIRHLPPPEVDIEDLSDAPNNNALNYINNSMDGLLSPDLSPVTSPSKDSLGAEEVSALFNSATLGSDSSTLGVKDDLLGELAHASYEQLASSSGRMHGTIGRVDEQLSGMDSLSSVLSSSSSDMAQEPY